MGVGFAAVVVAGFVDAVCVVFAADAADFVDTVCVGFAADEAGFVDAVCVGFAADAAGFVDTVCVVFAADEAGFAAVVCVGFADDAAGRVPLLCIWARSWAAFTDDAGREAAVPEDACVFLRRLAARISSISAPTSLRVESFSIAWDSLLEVILRLTPPAA